MGRSSTTTDLYQPLRRFAPPPHQWGGAALLQICISPSGASRHLPINGEEQHYYRSVSAPPSGFARHLPINGEEQLIEKKGPGLHRTPARKRLTKRLKRSVLLLLRGLLGGLLGRLLGSLLLSHHAITSFSQRYGPDRFHRFGGFHVVVSRGQDSLLHVPPLQPHGLRRGSSWMRTPRRRRTSKMVRFLASGPLPLWWQPRVASPYEVL